MIYFIQARHGGPIKIGSTTDLYARLRALQTSAAGELRIIATCDGDQVREREIHTFLDRFRVRGEWFADCIEVEQFIDAFGTPHHQRRRSLNGRWSEGWSLSFRAALSLGYPDEATRYADIARDGGVCPRTAQNWFEGSSDPRAPNLIALAATNKQVSVWYQMIWRNRFVFDEFVARVEGGESLQSIMLAPPEGITPQVLA